MASRNTLNGIPVTGSVRRTLKGYSGTLKVTSPSAEMIQEMNGGGAMTYKGVVKGPGGEREREEELTVHCLSVTKFTAGPGGKLQAVSGKFTDPEEHRHYENLRRRVRDALPDDVPPA